MVVQPVAHPPLPVTPGLQDYVDDIFASYVLMLTILVLTAVGLWCRPYHSRPAILGVVLDSTPQPYVVTPTKSQQYGFSR